MKARIDLRPLIALALLAGCAAEETFATSHQAVTFSSFPPAGALCSARRMVVHDPSATCAPAAGWVVAPVMTAPSTSALAEYCLYEYGGVGEPTSNQVALLPPLGSDRDPDCLVVAPQSNGWIESYDAFKDQIDAPYLAITSEASLPGQTWIAFLDTSPTPTTLDGVAVVGNNPHGYGLARIAREIGCPNGPVSPTCLIHAHHELALPWTYDGTTWTNPTGGGDFGYQTDLARATARAVDTWLAGRANPSTRLVLNLSLGWLSAYGGPGGGTAADPVPVRAVYAALEKAACQGVAIYAAAGNWSGGSAFDTGPMYPGGWNDAPAPSIGRCAEIGSAGFDYAPHGYLLEAVGGVDGRDRPLPNRRINGTPRLVAPAVRGTAWTLDGTPGPILTGTSVATALASSAAAIAWAYAPNHSPSKVANLLHNAGAGLGYFADAAMCVGTCEDVRRLSVCGAVASACLDPYGNPYPSCPTFSCKPRSPFEDATPKISVSMLDPPDDTITIQPMTMLSGVTPSQCGPTVAQYRPVGSTGPGPSPCPDRQRYSGNAHPSVVPQPGPNVCPECFINIDYIGGLLDLHIYLEKHAPEPLFNPTLLLVTPVGEFRYGLWEHGGGMELFTLSRYELNGIPLGVAHVDDAFLIGETHTGEAWRSPLTFLDGP